MRCGADMRALGRDVRKIGAGGNRLNSGQCLRLFGIDRDDPRMGMRAALDAAPQHTRQCHISAEIGPARDLVNAVGADRPGADNLKRGLVEIAHLHSPPVPDAAGIGIRPVAPRVCPETLATANGLLSYQRLSRSPVLAKPSGPAETARPSAPRHKGAMLWFPNFYLPSTA